MPRDPIVVLPSRNKNSLLARVFGDKPMPPPAPIYCGRGCDCQAECGDAYEGLEKPPKRPVAKTKKKTDQPKVATKAAKKAKRPRS